MNDLEKKLLATVTAPAWKKIGVSHHHGMNVPLISIHTKNSCGNGEFFDLIPLIDWCHQLGLDIIQLLPLNESGKDPSPYNALSSCALHPIYLSLHALPYLNSDQKKELKPFATLGQTKRIHYDEIHLEKSRWLKRYIATHQDKLKKEEEYLEFVTKQHWLPEYALFKVLKNRYNQTHWKHWPEDIRSPSKNKLKELLHTYSEEVQQYFLLQYLCFKQLKEVKAYAKKKGVFLKGDIPILISPDSADVWIHREFFDLSHVAGSPPNSFNPEGQYWGFPLYNWKAMSENHYEWWKTRLIVARELYDIYRIDHIIGFFRIWAIPPDESPCTGKYIPDNLQLMQAQGKQLLETFVQATDMLPIGEDLGNTPLFVRDCLEELGICGTRVIRWERNWEGDQSYIPISQYSPASMTTVSTHDINTVRLWWQEKPEESLVYAENKNWPYQKVPTPEQQLEILQDSHRSSSLFHINLLQEYLALTPDLTWENPEDERINYPGTIQPLNWTYRYKEPIETLASDEKLREYFTKILGKR